MKIPALDTPRARGFRLPASVLALFLLLFTAVSPASAETAELKDQEGRTITAEIVSTEGTMVTIRRADGKEFTIAKGSFDQATQDLITQWERHRAVELKKASLPPSLGEVTPGIQELINSGILVAAQVAFSQDGEILATAQEGTVGTDDKTPINQETLFLTGSASMPFAAAILLALIDDPGIDVGLDDGVDKWLPAYKDLTMVGDKTPTRVPTVTELLNHFSGMFGLRRGVKDTQEALLYNFKQDLATLADGLAKEPLVVEPGTAYAFSGAGYAVAGRIAEIAAEKTFEELLQEQVVQKLGLQHTTYFPSPDNSNVATGSITPEKTPPHLLGPDLKLANPGVSLYSTATEMALFSQAVLGRSKARLASDNLLGAIKSRPFSGSNFGFGWKIEAGRYLTVVGSFQNYRSTIKIDQQTGVCAAACWTLRVITSEGRASGEIFRLINAPLRDLAGE